VEQLDKTQDQISKSSLAKECKDYLQGLFDHIRQEIWTEVIESEESAKLAHHVLKAVNAIEAQINADIQGGKKALRKLEVRK
jgi:predicted RNase H-related nuclease YkuK (DUF458 family)